MQQPLGLVPDGRHDLRVGMARRADRDAGVEVQEHVAVHVLDHGAGPPGRGERVGPGQRGAGDLVVGLDQQAGLRARDLRGELRLGHGLELVTGAARGQLVEERSEVGLGVLRPGVQVPIGHVSPR